MHGFSVEATRGNGHAWHEGEDGARATAREVEYATGASFAVDGGMLLMAAAANEANR